MGNSLQEQLLKAGVADKATAKKARSEKRKKQKQHKQQIPADEIALAAAKALEEKRQRDLALNLQQQQEREAKALLAQAKQIIDMNVQPKGKPETTLNVVEDNLIKRLSVSQSVHKLVVDGRLAVVRGSGEMVLVPMPVADKVWQRVPELVLYRADKLETAAAEEDDWYADYKIPDDLMW